LAVAGVAMAVNRKKAINRWLLKKVRFLCILEDEINFLIFEASWRLPFFALVMKKQTFSTN
jgi:hypothetical protein